MSCMNKTGNASHQALMPKPVPHGSMEMQDTEEHKRIMEDARKLREAGAAKVSSSLVDYL
jgi:hypothetical protein